MPFSSGRLLQCGWLLLALAEFGAAPARANSVAPTEVTSVIELFTSQGCSSCPPADRLLSTLARAPDVVALSFPIDYWDYIGWRDTLASPAFTARQKAYASSLGDPRIYTPQAIIDGLSDAVGSDKSAIERAVGLTHGRDGALTVPMRLTETKRTLHIEIGAGPQVAAGVYVLRVAKSETVEIGRGENSGRSVTYTNVVRAITKIGDWDGKAQSFELMELKSENEGYVVLLQKGDESSPGAILAAAKSSGF
jgi:hypothetical protein